MHVGGIECFGFVFGWVSDASRYSHLLFWNRPDQIYRRGPHPAGLHDDPSLAHDPRGRHFSICDRDADTGLKGPIRFAPKDRTARFPHLALCLDHRGHRLFIALSILSGPVGNYL